LAPYWAQRLGKTDLRARQLSRRTGTLGCRVEGQRVHVSGTAVQYLRGEIEV
jgi:predicted PhzF superfamily epimerase YddE/YHI9